MAHFQLLIAHIFVLFRYEVLWISGVSLCDFGTSFGTVARNYEIYTLNSKRDKGVS